MTKLDEIAARADAATKGPWSARTSGRSGGDHWYICDDGEAIAHISAQDGINEDQREPDAEFIAHAREDVPKLVTALRAAMSFHRNEARDKYGRPADAPTGHGGWCYGCGRYDGDGCPEITAIREAMGE